MKVSPILKPSRAVASFVEGQTRLTVCESVVPTKFLHPYFSDHALCVMQSSYGGGMVQGDHVFLELECEEKARLFVGTQANSRVYRNASGAKTEIHTTGHVGAEGLMVVLPDPLVMHAGSQLEQMQDWNVAPGGSLLLSDWLQSGRSDSGEAFRFDAYQSTCRIYVNGELVVLEPFRCPSGEALARRPGCFGQANHVLTLFAVGPVRRLLEQALGPLSAEAAQTMQVPALTGRPHAPAPRVLMALESLEDRPVSIFRALAETRQDLDAVFTALGKALASEEWLGADPSRLLRI